MYPNANVPVRVMMPPARVELTVPQLLELKTAIDTTEDPTSVMTRLGSTPQSEPYAKDESLGMDSPMNLPPPDDYSRRIWLRNGHEQDEHWDITILEHARKGYNGSAPSLAVLES